MTGAFNSQPCEKILHEVLEERARQHDKWGVQNLPLGTGSGDDKLTAHVVRGICNRRVRSGEHTYRDLLSEEMYEAFAEVDPVLVRAELVQVAAVAVQAIEAIDRRAAMTQEELVREALKKFDGP